MHEYVCQRPLARRKRRRSLFADKPIPEDANGAPGSQSQENDSVPATFATANAGNNGYGPRLEVPQQLAVAVEEQDA